MKTKTHLLFLLLLVHFQPCIAQQSQTTFPKVENHLKGELDYTYEALELVQMQANGEDIILGKINTDGTIHFDLPKFDIKALYDSIPLQHYNFYSWFSIDSSCKDRDVFAKTSFDDVYSQKTNAIYIKKYGIEVAVLEIASDKKKIRNHNATKDSLAVLNTYYWFYIDRAITYKDECTKISHSSNKTYATINADISFEKGWNFIEENVMWNLNYDKSNPNSIQLKKTHFTKSSPTSKKVKWSLRQVANNEEIQTAKRLYNLTPITKEQFEKWAPNKLGDLSLTTKDHGNPPKGQKNKNNIHLIYTNKTKNKEIDLYIVDFAKNADDMEMVNFSFAMENRGKDKKDIKPYIAQYSERKKATQLLYKIEDRIVVEASAVNINAEDLWSYIQKLNVEKLLNKINKVEITNNSDTKTVKFEGIITNTKNDCWQDGTCSIEVDNKWWVAITYGKRDPSRIPKERGQVIGIRFTKDNESIGKRVKVYAEIKKNNKLTLEGSKTYYVKTIE